MKVIRANVLGFCMGVRRAQDIAFKEADACGKTRIFTLGSLVHNPKVLDDLKERGVETLAEIPSDLKGCKVIIRAHGISPQKENELGQKGAEIIDATCPKVKKSQVIARELAGKGYCIFLAGEKNHAEIEGILGYASEALADEKFCIVVGNVKEAETAAASACKNEKTALIGQTTISEEEYSGTAKAIKKYFPNLEVCDTICSAAKDRQDALRDLIKKAEAIIIAGGKDSSNTRRLLAIAKGSGKPCLLAESAQDIQKDFFNYKTIGISAGASTPDSVIEEIEMAFKNALN